MAIHTRVVTKLELPEFIEVEVEDTVKGTKTLRRVPFHKCVERMSGAAPLNVDGTDPADLLAMVFAMAKHVAIDEYLESIGVDPHSEVRRSKKD